MTLWGCSEGCQPTDGHVCLDFGLSRYGEELYLYDPLGTLLDQVQVPEMEKMSPGPVVQTIPGGIANPRHWEKKTVVKTF